MIITLIALALSIHVTFASESSRLSAPTQNIGWAGYVRVRKGKHWSFFCWPGASEELKKELGHQIFAEASPYMVKCGLWHILSKANDSEGHALPHPKDMDISYASQSGYVSKDVKRVKDKDILSVIAQWPLRREDG